MILIGLGSNLTTPQYNSSKKILEAAIEQLANYQVEIIAVSNFYQTEPVPKSDQPWFVNAVISVKTNHEALELLKILHEIELNLGRTRRQRWEARIIDLDLLSYNDEIFPDQETWLKKSKEIMSDQPVIPHGRMHERDFVLIPLCDIHKEWQHPVLHKTAQNLLNEHSGNAIVRLL